MEQDLIGLIKIVQVKHPGCGIVYTFEAPRNVTLAPGEYVFCETKRSPMEIGQCITPSFFVNEIQLRTLYNITLKNLKPIVGRLNPEMFIEKRQVEE